MLTGDRAKYFGFVFAIAFCTFLLKNQTSIFANILRRTATRAALTVLERGGLRWQRHMLSLEQRGGVRWLTRRGVSITTM